MGRNKKYLTDDERRLAKLTQWKSYYIRKKNIINTHRMKKYYEQRIEYLQKKLSDL
jgi:hypothetical protein